MMNFILALILISTSTFALTPKDLICTTSMERNPYFALVRVGLSLGVFNISDLKQAQSSRQPLDISAAKSNLPNAPALKEAMRKQVSSARVLEQWQETRESLSQLIQHMESQSAEIERAHEATRAKFSPGVIHKFSGWTGQIATVIDGEKVLAAYVDSTGKLGIYDLAKNDGSWLVQLQMPVEFGIEWTSGWHRNAEGVLELWISSNAVTKVFKINLSDGALKEVQAQGLNSIITGWFSVPGHKMLANTANTLLDVTSGVKAKWQNFSAPATVGVNDRFALVADNKTHDFVDINSSVFARSSIKPIFPSQVERFFTARNGDLFLAYETTDELGHVAIENLSHPEIRPVVTNVGRGLLTAPDIVESPDGRIFMVCFAKQFNFGLDAVAKIIEPYSAQAEKVVYTSPVLISNTIKATQWIWELGHPMAVIQHGVDAILIDAIERREVRQFKLPLPANWITHKQNAYFFSSVGSDTIVYGVYR